MKGIRIWGACLLAALAAGAVAATPALSVNLPEAGRCVKVAVGTGAYSTANCLTHATKGGGKYEWVPVSSTEKPAFSGTGGETTLTTVGHPTIKCIDANFTGEYLGPKTASVQIEFQGCQNPTEQLCQSIPSAGKSEIKTMPLEAELGFIRNEEIEGKVFATVGMDLKPQPPLTNLATYECEGSSENAHLEGSVIGKLTPIDKMTTTLNLLYLARRTGQQVPEMFQGGSVDTLSTTFTSGLETVGSGASSLNIKNYTGHNAAPLEIKAIDK